MTTLTRTPAVEGASMRTRGRRVLRVAASTALAVLTLAGLAAAGARVTSMQAKTPAPSPVTGYLPSNRPTSGGPLVVAVALGTSGTVGSDALAPYEVFPPPWSTCPPRPAP